MKNPPALKKAIVFLYSILRKESILSLFALFSLTASVTCQCWAGKDVCGEVCTIFASIFASCFAGFIFYIFTSAIPYYRKHKAIHYEISELYRAISDTFRDLSGELVGGDWLEDDTLKYNAVDYITMVRDKQESLESGQSHMIEGKDSKFIANTLSYYIGIIDSFLNQLVVFYEYIDYETISQLTKMKTSKSFQRCRTIGKYGELLNKEKSRELIEGLVQCNLWIKEIVDNTKNNTK